MSAARDLFQPRKTVPTPSKLNIEILAQRLQALEGDRVDFAPGGQIISDEQLDQVLDRSVSFSAPFPLSFADHILLQDATMRGEKVVEAASSKKMGKRKERTKAVFSAVETIVLDEDSEDEDEKKVERLFRV